MLREIDIQPTDRVAFIHIPKTAGITFSTIIHPFLAQLPWCPVIIAENLVQVPYEELKLFRFFTGHFRYRLLEKIFPEGFVSLTFLREPISRTMSHYTYLMRQESLGGPPWGDEELHLVKNMTFDEFVTNQELHIALDIINIQTGYWGGFESPRELTTDEDENEMPSIAEHLKELAIRINSKPTLISERKHIAREHLEMAKKRLEQAGFFGIMERFQDSLFLLCFIFGWPPILDAIRLNHRPDKETNDTIDPHTLAQIQNKVALDLEFYQFASELFDQYFDQMTRTLLERYGDGTLSATARPLSTEQLCELLQKHYETRRDRRNQTLLKHIGRVYLYRPSSHAEGVFGWHAVEMTPEDGPVAWSGPGRESGFDLPRPRGEKIRVSFRIIMVLASDIIDNFSVTINHVPISLQTKTDARGTFIFTGIVPSQALTGPFLHIVFSVPRTIAPCDITPNNKDARKLGMLLNWVKLESFS